MIKQNALHLEATLVLDQKYQPDKLRISIAQVTKQQVKEILHFFLQHITATLTH